MLFRKNKQINFFIKKNNYLFLFGYILIEMKNAIKLFILTFVLKRKFILILITFLSFSSIKAQDLFIVSGIVTNESEIPLSAVSINAKGDNVHTSSDFDGLFDIKLSEGNYTIYFSKEGYENQSISITIPSTRELKIILTKKTEILDEVLVQAVRVKEKAPITHTNVSKAALAKRNLAQDIPILLNFLPSVVTTSDAGAGVGYTAIRVRGINAQSTNITINGIPYNDAESLGTFWVNLGDFASSVESLQVQRGVGTSTNGSGAFGASINLLTDAVSETASASLASSYGSFNTSKNSLKFSTGKLQNCIEIAGRLSHIKSDGYIDRAFSNLKSYFLQATYINQKRLLKAITFSGHEKTYQSWNGLEDVEKLQNDRTFNSAGMYTNEEGRIKFYENEIDNYKQDHYQIHWNEKINNHWSTNLALNYTKGKGYFEQYKEGEAFEDYNLEPLILENDTINTTNLIRRRWLDNQFYVVNANATFKKNSFITIFGGSFSTYLGDHFGEIIWAQYASNSEINQHYYNGNGKKEDLSIFGKATFKIAPKLEAFTDVQLRLVNYTTNGLTSKRVPLILDKKYTFFNPKVGLTYTLNKNNNFYFSFARANREPSRDDFENNTNIQPEQLNDLELGYRHTSKSFTFNTNLYYMVYNEQLVLTGAIDDVGNPIRKNSGKSYRLGLEIETAFTPINWLTIQPNLTLSSNKNKNTVVQQDGNLVHLGKTNISYAPNFVSATAFIFRPIKNLEVTFLNKYVSKQYMGNTDSATSQLDSYSVSDLSVNYQFKPNKIVEEIHLSALVNNMFNAKYSSNGYYYTYDDTWSNPNQITTIEGVGYYPQATINFLFGIQLHF